MAIRLPQNNWRQYNRSDFLGDLDQTYNCDLTSNEGIIAFTRTKRTFSEEDDEDFSSDVVAWAIYDDKLWAFTRSDGPWTAGLITDNPESSFTQLTGASVPGSPIIDAEIFNGYLYASEGGSPTQSLPGKIFKVDSDGSWSEITSSLANNSSPILAAYGDLLYFSHSGFKVGSVSTGDSESTTTSTLDLGLTNDHQITMLKAGSDRLWIGVQDTEHRTGALYEWDGETQDTFTRQYHVQHGVVAGTVKNGVPFIIDGVGRLLTVSGGGMVELDRFPIDEDLLRSAFAGFGQRFVGINCIIPDEDRLLINVENQSNVSSNDVYQPKMPSGVWEWSEQTGLYHKYSLSDSDIGSSTADDFGQQISEPGALMRFTDQRDESKNGVLLIGGQTNNLNHGVYIVEIQYDTPRAGYFVTAKIKSREVSDQYTDFILKLRQLDEGKFIVKYRTQETEPLSVDATWLSTTQFTTTGDISNFSVGDEVEVRDGAGAGSLRHVTAISESASTYTVTLDEAVVASLNDTSTIRFDKWTKAGEYSGDLQYARFPSSAEGAWIQYKVYYEGTGRGEVYEAIINNQVSKQI